MTTRRTLSRLARIRIHDRHGGMCWICDTRITTGQKWQADHMKPLWLGGEDIEANMAPAHVHCHASKSAAERTVKAKGDRSRARYLGIRKSKHLIPGSKGTPWRKRMNGTVESR